MATEYPITATTLERQADALINALVAWVYPSDIEARDNAQQICALADVDYIESVAKILERSPQAHPDQARWAVAMGFLDNVATLRSQGVQPRLGIVMSGRQADSLGRDPLSVGQRDPDDDDYGSLA